MEPGATHEPWQRDAIESPGERPRRRVTGGRNKSVFDHGLIQAFIAAHTSGDRNCDS